jgi:epoxide hydrolase-like predicted phosphatase
VDRTQDKNASHRRWRSCFSAERVGTIARMSIKAIIFDLGGVILRTEDQAPRTALGARHGLSYYDLSMQVLDGEDSRTAQVGGMSSAEFWDAASAKYGMAHPAFRDEFFAGDQLDWELIAAIRGLRGKYKTALLSNAFDDLRELISNDWKFHDAFDVMVVSAEVKMMKPDPRIYTYTIGLLSVEPGEAVFIDDVPANIDAAHKVGLHGVRFSSRQQALSDLHALLGSN